MGMQTVNGVTLSYTDQGNRQALVLLHAFPVDSRMWAAQISDLAPRCRVIAPDFRGFGQSPPAGPFTIPSLVDDVHALLTALGALPCVLAGTSMGGYVALNFARKYPTDLRGLVLVDTKAEADNPEQRENRNKMIEVARTMGAKAVADAMSGKMLSPETFDHRPETVQALRAMMEACPVETIVHALTALRDRPDMSDALPSVCVPTLILVGEEDAITPLAVAQSMQRQIPRAELKIVRGAGHMSPMEQPEQVNQALANFVAGLA
ncbi:MAG TPA: alpha/beta fold hydrolase [Tepidisphaeraceae bacterium]|jgi:pimeloyl-ACP methyl ester carboxylesterase|nr:alpha/beta fold hydrolase [Tepidisphaeraceae bacterium]